MDHFGFDVRCLHGFGFQSGMMVCLSDGGWDVSDGLAAAAVEDVGFEPPVIVPASALS